MTSTLEHKPLGELLVTRGALTPANVERALDEQKRSNHQKLLGEILVELSFCSEDQVTEALAETYNVPYARISPRVADPKIVRLLPREFLDKHCVIPLFLVQGTLTVAVQEPANIFLTEEIERLSGHPVQVVAATAHDIRATLGAFLPGGDPFVIDDLIDDSRPIDFTVVEQRPTAAAKVQAGAGETAAAKLVDYCIYHAVKDGATDVHFEPGDNALRIRARIDGRMSERLRPPFQLSAAVAARLKRMAGLDLAQRLLPQEGDLHAMIDKRPVDLRVTTMPGRFGEMVVVRVLDSDKAAVTLEKLGFSYDCLKQWRSLLGLSSGALIVTGPAGGGKTSTLYASLLEMNSAEVSICTIEDPVHCAIAGVNQFQVDEKAGLTFPQSLHSLLRQGPDVIVVGETRDPDTARAVTQAALTGHLVLTTLHSLDAPSAITRLLNLGVEPYLVGASLAGVLAQRLVRKLCQACKEPYAPSLAERRNMEAFGGSVDTLFRPKGCPRCRNLGFHGRIGLFELLAIEDTLAERISRGAALADVRTAARSAGMRTLRADGVEKVKAGITTLQEVFRVTA
jgi:type IV pilus assembly protein PilB